MKIYLVICLSVLLGACTTIGHTITPTEYVDRLVPVVVDCQNVDNSPIIVKKPKMPLDSFSLGQSLDKQTYAFQKQDALSNDYLTRLEAAAKACGVKIEE